MRTTVDADFLICEDDFPGWKEALQTVGYRWIGQTQAFAKFLPPETTPPSLPVDIMLVTRETFLKLQEDHRELEFGPALLPVPHPLHLIALKLHAMKNDHRRSQGKDLPDILQIIRLCSIDTAGVTSSALSNVMPMSKPALNSTPPCNPAEDNLFDLPEIPADYREPEMPPPTWEAQMAHAQMLLAWRRARGIEPEEPPRNPERFVM